MTLEEQAIAAFRKGLLKANSSQLLQFWAEAITLKGGNESVIFDEMACRDIVAYTIIHFINIRSATIFGGFIRSHFSGKPWHDIDIFSGNDTPTEFMISLVEFLCIVLCFQKHQISFHRHSPSPYGASFNLKIMCSTPSCIPSSWTSENTTAIAHPLTIIIKLDLVRCTNQLLFETEYLKDRLPVTIGSCLQMQRGVVTFRSTPRIRNRVDHWLPEEIIDLLKNGNDVKLSLKRHPPRTLKRAQQYREFYWYRITNMKKDWNLLTADGTEPASFSEEELRQLMERMTMQKIQRANHIIEE
tara:strand:- start:211 stop:1110 length:900 start_codon:yes stop_codon:yes gene_type:complete